MPLIEGAIITAKGTNDAEVKTNIINAVQAATGLSIDRVQVFEMKWISIGLSLGTVLFDNFLTCKIFLK